MVNSMLTGSYCHPVQPYEDKPNLGLRPVLARRGGLSCSLETFVLSYLTNSFFCSDLSGSFLNGLTGLKEEEQIFYLFFFFFFFNLNICLQCP